MSLTTLDLHVLDGACAQIRHWLALDREEGIYLVGSAERQKSGWRDVDVRAILTDENFDSLFQVEPDGMALIGLWEMLSAGGSAYLRMVTGLPIDFQIQRRTEADEQWGDYRNPLGRGRRVFAGAGDATPWNRTKDRPAEPTPNGPEVSP